MFEELVGTLLSTRKSGRGRSLLRLRLSEKGRRIGRRLGKVGNEFLGRIGLGLKWTNWWVGKEEVSLRWER